MRPLLRPAAWRLGTYHTPLLLVGVLLGGMALRAPIMIAAVAGAALLHAAHLRRQLKDERAWVAALLQQTPDVIIGLAADGSVLQWNHAAERLFGWSTLQVQARSLDELLVPLPARGELEARLKRLLAGETMAAFNCRLLHQDGRALELCVTLQAAHNGRGACLGATMQVQDPGPQRVIATRLATLTSSLEQQTAAVARHVASNRLQRAMLENAECALLATDTHGILTLFNAAAESLFGYQAMHLIGKASPVILLDDSSARAGASAPDFSVWTGNNRDGESRECTCICANGRRIPVQLTVKPIRDAAGTTLAWLAVATDLSARRQEARDKRLLLEILQLAPDFIGVADLEGHFKYHNHGALAALGLPADVDPGRLNPCAIFPEWGVRLLLDQALPTVLREGVWSGSNALLQPDGHEIPVSQVLMLHRNAAGEPEFLSTIVRDLSEHKRRERELAEAREQAEAASRAKSLYLATMSHEIRTPIHAMLGLLQLLRRSASSASQLDYIARTSTVARVLLGNLEEVLDLSRVEAGHIALDIHVFELETVLQAVAVIMGSSLGDKPVELLFEIEPALPAKLMGDSLRLQQVLINLAGNAIKFTDHGEVLIAIRMESVDADGVTLRFSVLDSGVGIAAQRCATIFDGYMQGEPSTARQYGGTGLGLSISQRLVRLMGGELTVVSEPGRGSLFHFALRLQRADADPAPPLPPARHVLIVHGSMAARRVLGAMMEGLAWPADSVAALDAALHLLRAHRHQLVLLDGLVLLNGEASVRAQLGEALGQGRLLLMGSMAHQYELERVLAEQQIPMCGFLEKPFTASMLLATLQRAAASGGPLAVPGKALTGLRILLVEDNILNQQVARELLVHEGASVELAGDGRLGVAAVQQAPRPFDLVLMDIHMPDMDGYEAARAIRRLGFHELPIIAMTADVTASDRAACLAAGMNDHVGKPFDLPLLIALIHRHVRPEPGQEGDPAARFGTAGEWLDIETAVRCFGSGNVYPRILQRFVLDAQPMADTLLQLLAEGRAVEAVELLHTLKGIAATVSATPLVSVSSWLERALGDDEQSALLPEKLEELRSILARTVAAATELAQASGGPAAFQAELRSLRLGLHS